MNLEERFASHLYRHGVRLLTGKKSRCYRSISVYTPWTPAGPVISIHPELFGARAVEALVFQLGRLDVLAERKRFRYTASNPDTIINERAWRRGAKLALPDAIWDRYMTGMTEGEEIEEMENVTRRLVQIRWNLWMAKQDNAFFAFSSKPDTSVTYTDEHFWCQVL